MKIKNIYIFFAAVLLLVGALFWKLNDYYKYEKFGEIRGRLRQQSLSLKTSVGSQVDQLKNIVSSYTGQIEESKINWVQLNPFYALARVSIGTKGNYIVKTLFTRSGSPADRWDQVYLQKAISFQSHQGLPLQIQMFQNQQGEKFIAIVFGDTTGINVTDATLLIGDANYFQKFFEIQKNKKTTHFLATTEGVVVAHTESEYIANKTNETKLNPKKNVLEKDSIRSSNLVVYSYVSPIGNAGWYVPFFITTFILGLTLVCIGLVLYVYKPSRAKNRTDTELDTPERALEKEKIFNRVLNEVKGSSMKLEPSLMPENPSAPMSFNLKPIQEEVEIPETSANTLTTETEIFREAPLPVMVEPIHGTQALQSLAESFSADSAGASEELYTLNHILDKSIATFQNQIEIDKEVFSERMYMMSEKRMIKAFENLIKNSIEAKATHLKICIERVHGEDRVTLTDDGNGINPNLLKEVVAPFYTTKNKSQHRGLGLPEAISIFERYGAEIEIKSLDAQSKGTQVVIKMKPTESSQMGTDVAGSLNVDVENLDLELDSILELDIPGAPIEKMLDSYEADLIQETQNVQFQINSLVEIDKDPVILIPQTQPQMMDQFKVQIRQPKLKGEDQI